MFVKFWRMFLIDNAHSSLCWRTKKNILFKFWGKQFDCKNKLSAWPEIFWPTETDLTPNLWGGMFFRISENTLSCSNKLGSTRSAFCWVLQETFFLSRTAPLELRFQAPVLYFQFQDPSQTSDHPPLPEASSKKHFRCSLTRIKCWH